MAEGSQKHILGAVGTLGISACCLLVTQQRLTVSLDLLCISLDSFGQRLVNGFVEPGEIIQVAQVRIGTAIPPKPNDAGAKRPILRNHCPQLEPRANPVEPVSVGSRFRPTLAAVSRPWPFDLSDCCLAV